MKFTRIKLSAVALLVILTSVLITGCSDQYKVAEAQGIQFSSDRKTLVKCTDKNNITECVIPNGVTTIGDKAFFDCDFLQSVTIPDSVTIIGNYAFVSCDESLSVTIPNRVTEIGDGAFIEVKNVNISSDHPYFYKNSAGALISKKDQKLIWFPPEYSGLYSIPDDVKTIGGGAFYECESLRSITIPDSVTTIGKAAFSDCYKLQSVIIPDSVTTIGGWAFDGCSNLKEVRVPRNCKIGKNAFPKDCNVIRY